MTSGNHSKAYGAGNIGDSADRRNQGSGRSSARQEKPPRPGPPLLPCRAETAASPLQACHEMVPPETMQPVLRQIVDQFVHDRWQPIAHSTSLCACLKVWRGLHDNSTMSLPQDSCEWRQEIS